MGTTQDYQGKEVEKMYGTVARVKAKPGFLEEIENSLKQRHPKGFIRLIVYRLDSDTDEYYMAVLFEDKQSYFSNANSPEQDAEYQKLNSYFLEDPVWHDGEVVSVVE